MTLKLSATRRCQQQKQKEMRESEKVYCLFKMKYTSIVDYLCMQSFGVYILV